MPTRQIFSAIPDMSPAQFRGAIEFLFGGYGAQRAFARCVGIHDATVRRYISGDRRIPEPIILLLAYMFQRRLEGKPVGLADVPGAIAWLLDEAGQNEGR